MDAPWRIQLLGTLRAERAGQGITRFRTQKAAALLAYLVYHQRPHPREILIELLWPECDVDVGRHRLSGALTLLRQVLEAEDLPGGAFFVADHFTIGVNPAALTTDVAEFEATLQAAAKADTPRRRPCCSRTRWSCIRAIFCRAITRIGSSPSSSACKRCSPGRSTS